MSSIATFRILEGWDRAPNLNLLGAARMLLLGRPSTEAQRLTGYQLPSKRVIVETNPARAAVEVLIDLHGFCYFQETIRAHCILQSFEQSLSSPYFIFIHTMRSTLLLASLLTVVPVRLICLASIPARTHMNNFVHSLYRRPPLRLAPICNVLLALSKVLLCPLARHSSSRHVTCKHMRFASLSEAKPVTPDGYTRFENSDEPSGTVLSHKVILNGGNTPRNCAIECAQLGYQSAGVENGADCCACFTSLFDELSSTT